MKDTIEEVKKLNSKIKETQDELSDYIKLEKEIQPQKEARKNAWIYGIFGVLWILITDNLVQFIVSDPKIENKLELYKGSFFVFITVMIIYILTKKVLVSYKTITKEIIDAHLKLNTTQEALIVAEHKLSKNFHEIEKQRNELHRIAFYNKLTRLPNKAGFEIEAKKIMDEKYFLNRKMGLLYLDINNFKYINNSLGRTIGDKLLWYTAAILKNKIKSPNIVAHIGGDDFAIFFPDIADTNDMIRKIEEIQMLFLQPWILENKEIFVSASIGAAIYPDNGDDIASLFKNAEIAMYYIKTVPETAYCIYSDKIAEESLEFTWMTNELRKAIRDQNLITYYQPLVDLRTGKIINVEVLSLWNHKVNGWISPAEFIPIAEKSGLIYELDKFVLMNACKQMKLWNEEGYSSIRISVNFSSKTLLNRNFIADLMRTVTKCNLDYSNIQIEITETVAIDDLDTSIQILNQLKSFGMKVALDDFGAGYSSLNYIKALPVDVIKLDAGFTKNIQDENQEEEITKTIIQLGHILDCQIVAEGIETEEQLKFLIKHKCDIGQGYLFSQPLPAKDLSKLLQRQEVYSIT